MVNEAERLVIEVGNAKAQEKGIKYNYNMFGFDEERDPSCKDNEVVVVFKPEIKKHPEFYMRIEGCFAQPWSPRWVELCIMKALSELVKESDMKKGSKARSTELEPDAELLKELLRGLKISDLQDVIWKKMIIEVQTPVYIPVEYFDKVYIRGKDFGAIGKDLARYLCERVDVLRTESPLKDAKTAIARLQSADSDSLSQVQSYSFGLDHYIENFAVRSVLDTYRFVCYQKKIDLTISFFGKDASALGDICFSKEKLTEAPKGPVKEFNLAMKNVNDPECGIEYLLSVKGKTVIVECWEIFYSRVYDDDDDDDDDDGKEQKVRTHKKPIILYSDKGPELQKKIKFGQEPVCLLIKTKKTHASITNFVMTDKAK